jgi:hypothetical protein
MFRFEKLEAWQLAIELARRVYSATSHFPDAERFGLTSQMRRAAVSISSNIAEGSGRATDTDCALSGNRLRIINGGGIAVTNYKASGLSVACGFQSTLCRLRTLSSGAQRLT